MKNIRKKPRKVLAPENFLVLHLTNRRVRNILRKLGVLMLKQENCFLENKESFLKVDLGCRWLTFLNFYSCLVQFHLWNSQNKPLGINFLRRRNQATSIYNLTKEESVKLPSKYGARYTQPKKLLNKKLSPFFTSGANYKSLVLGEKVFTTSIGAVLNLNRLAPSFFKKNFLISNFNVVFWGGVFFQFFSFCVMLQIANYARFFGLSAIYLGSCFVGNINRK